MFAYCGNNPVSSTDYDGERMCSVLEPDMGGSYDTKPSSGENTQPSSSYTLFNSPDEAAVAFANEAHYPSIVDGVDGKERGAMIYLTVQFDLTGCHEYYYYSRVYVGGHDNVVVAFIGEYGYALLSCSGNIPVAWAHTHTECECHYGNEFSPQDRWLTNLLGIESVYLSAANGSIFKYDGNSTTTVPYFVGAK